MNLNIYNRNFEKVSVFDTYTSLIWCKRYYDVGALDLQVEATVENINTLKKNYYITRDDDDTVYRITSLSIDTQEDHDNSLIVGAVDVKDILNQRIVWFQTNFSGTVEDYIRKLVSENLMTSILAYRNIPNFQLKDKKGFTDTIIQQVTYDSVGDKVSELCKAYGYGYRVTVEDRTFYFDLYSGADRSDGQTTNPIIKFSPTFDNLISSKYETKSDKFKNAALVAGEGEGTDRKRVYVGDNISGINRFEVFIEANSSTVSEEEITPAEYIEQLKSTGEENLANMTEETSFEGEINLDQYKYKTDFDLGDIVTIENEYGIKANARIIEIVETWDEKGYSILPRFEYFDIVEPINVPYAILTENSLHLMSENNFPMTTERAISGSVDSIKISELPETLTVEDSCVFPVVKDGETMKIDYTNIKVLLKGEKGDKGDTGEKGATFNYYNNILKITPTV